MCRGTRFTRDLHICATVFTEFSVGIVPLTAALGTTLCRNDALLVLHGPFSRYDARWHGEYSIPSDHEEGSHGLAHVGLWCDITVSYRCYCNDRPVNAARYAGETVLSSFYEIHHSADYDDYVNHCEIENHDFSATTVQCARELTRFADILRELKDAKYTENPERANNQQVLRAWDKNAQVRWNDRQEIDDAVKAKCVA